MNKKIFSSISYILLATILVVLAWTMVSFAGTWVDPTSSSDSRAVFVNSGPVQQIKSGRVNIGGNTTLPNAGFESHNPAEFFGGLFVNGPGANSAVIQGNLYVGYSDPLTPAPSQANYNLNGNTTVTNNINVSNLAHGTSGDLKPVCTTPDGWLTDDSTCDFVYLFGCRDINASNYSPTATVDNGSCAYVGCTDPTMANYDSQATIDDGSCQPILYATDPPYNNGCFVAGTRIALADGTTKAIEDVQIDDVLLGSKGENPVMKRYVIDYKGYIFGINGSDPFFTTTHPFMTTDGWKSLDPEGTRIESPGLDVSKLQRGDVLVRENGTYEKIESFTREEVETTVYNFGLNGSRDFYADGYLTHNVNLGVFTPRTVEAAAVKGP